MDSRLKKLAGTLVNYSCRVKSGENVMIECFGSSPHELIKEIVREVYKVGGIPYVSLKDNSILREILKECSIKQLQFMAKIDLLQMKSIDAYIGIRAHENVSELGDINGEKMNLYSKYYSDIIAEERVNNTKWVVLRWPNHSMAQLANTSLESFENF